MNTLVKSIARLDAMIAVWKTGTDMGVRERGIVWERTEEEGEETCTHSLTHTEEPNCMPVFLSPQRKERKEKKRDGDDDDNDDDDDDDDDEEGVLWIEEMRHPSLADHMVDCM